MRPGQIIGRVYRARLALLLALAAAGCGAVPFGPPPTLPNSRARLAGRVYLLRGLYDVFSEGLDSLENELRAVGVNATAMSGPQWPDLMKTIERQRAEGADREPLVLIGHSFGADDAVSLTRALDYAGIRVDLLLLWDGTNPSEIPANVVRCLHLYVPANEGVLWPDLFSGNPVVAEPGNTRTLIENVVIPADEVLGKYADLFNHFLVDESAWVRRRTIDEVLDLLGQEPMDGEAAQPQTAGE